MCHIDFRPFGSTCGTATPKKIFINGQWKLLTPLNITDKEVRMDTVLHALYFLIVAEESKKDSH